MIKNKANLVNTVNSDEKASFTAVNKANNMGRETGFEPAAFRATI